jgi:4-amino-4-deoxy-L-arabinose transferase-like glycosyltransferase
LAADFKKADRAVIDGAREARAITPKQVVFALAGIFILNLLLRVFYLRYDFVNGDEGVRALTALRLLEGARLYVDVVTDKPPGTTFFYAAVFAIFGRSMAAVHLAAALWNFATAVVIYLTGARLYGKRAGLWAALLFVYFSTNYLTQDVMAANTELLMALPYTAAFYLYLRASSRARSWPLLLAAGAMAGAAALFKQVGVLALLFFALYELIVIFMTRR